MFCGNNELEDWIDEFGNGDECGDRDEGLEDDDEEFGNGDGEFEDKESGDWDEGLEDKDVSVPMSVLVPIGGIFEGACSNDG